MNLNIDPIQPIFFIPEKLNQPLFIKNWSLKPHLDPKLRLIMFFMNNLINLKPT